MKLKSTPARASGQVVVLVLLLGACIWAMLVLRSCAEQDDLPFWSTENRERIARLYLEPTTRTLIGDHYDRTWRFPFDDFVEDDPESLRAIAADRSLRERSALVWDALRATGYLDEFNHRILRRHAVIDVGFALGMGRRPVILVDSTSWWHIFWSDGSTSTVVKPEEEINEDPGTPPTPDRTTPPG